MFLMLLTLVLSFPIISLSQASAQQDNKTSEAPAADNSTLFESGEATKVRKQPTPTSFRVVSYNIRWRSGDNLQKLIELFRDDEEVGNATVLALQEVDRNKQRSGKTNTARQLAEELGLYYAWAAPPSAKANSEEETGVAILSVYPLSKVTRIVLPNEGPGRRRRVALGASVRLGDVEVRIYSAHAETRIGMDRKLEQFSALLTDLKDQAPNSPAIIMGDLNTWQGSAERKTIKLFTDAGFTTPFPSQTTFSRRLLFLPIDLRLDWIWFRGLEPVNYGVDRTIRISDHFPLWTTVKLRK